MTKLDTTVVFLDKNGLWEDMERPNDISYYEVVAPAVTSRFACAPTPPRPIHPARQPPKPQAEPHPNQVGQGTFEGKYATQGKGYRHCIPRVDVSVGEKVRFAHLLGQLAVAAAKSGREAAQVRGRGRPGEG